MALEAQDYHSITAKDRLFPSLLYSTGYCTVNYGIYGESPAAWF